MSDDVEMPLDKRWTGWTQCGQHIVTGKVCDDYRMSDVVETPLVARQLDWVNTMWPLSIGTLPTVYKRPEVQKYCLIGVKDSYTDFHIDFGGTSVWYHVLRVSTTFILTLHLFSIF